MFSVLFNKYRAKPFVRDNTTNRELRHNREAAGTNRSVTKNRHAATREKQNSNLRFLIKLLQKEVPVLIP